MARLLSQQDDVAGYDSMSAYRKGLTGAAPARAVRKQKQHRAINQMVMMVINILTNPAAPVVEFC